MRTVVPARPRLDCHARADADSVDVPIGTSGGADCQSVGSKAHQVRRLATEPAAQRRLEIV